jgi:hypothetical protein
MSHWSTRPNSQDEIDLLTSLENLSISGPNQGIAKTGSTTFTNVTLGGGTALLAGRSGGQILNGGVAQTETLSLKGNAATATGANIAGGEMNYYATPGTGTGVSGHHFFTGTTLATGSTLQTSSEKMTILGNGNVGIGTTSPGYALTLESGQLALPNGSVSSPSVFFPSSNVGIFGLSEAFYFSSAGSYIAKYTSSGLASPGYSFFGIDDASAKTIKMGQLGNLTFSSSTSVSPNQAADINISRGAAGKLYVGNGTQGDFTGTLIAGNVGIGTTSPTAYLHLKAGTATAGTAPLKFNTGTLLTSAEAGAMEFLTDAYYVTTTTGAIRRMLTAGNLGRVTAQTAANASVATYTLGATDASYEVSANVLVTTSSAEAFTVTCNYTDEGNTARTITFNFSNIAGTIGTGIAFANGAVPYEGIPLHIRCKASTAITIKTAAGGTYTGCTYNCESSIRQIG